VGICSRTQFLKPEEATMPTLTGRVLRKSIVRTAKNSHGSHEMATVDAVILLLEIDADKSRVVVKGFAYEQPSMTIAGMFDNVRWDRDEKGTVSNFQITEAR
jgi:hypothetical protein